ncbi:hypothetical protein N7510_005433 [Penicillium lagena]|uniref:uncharacterized protein n=1 Tax=Penicillium lagena TaxID=94218 RepID=UPI002540BC34|nr:uncharacterized protein N7510_005433 [Penicillium lagena]KAJ5612239.1 hypothetical protein N7510_005433 [Penicillium lagena]
MATGTAAAFIQLRTVFLNKVELYEDVYKSWTGVCKSLPTDCAVNYTIQPMGKAGVQARKDRGESIMGHESIPQCSVSI